MSKLDLAAIEAKARSASVDLKNLAASIGRFSGYGGWSEALLRIAAMFAEDVPALCEEVKLVRGDREELYDRLTRLQDERPDRGIEPENFCPACGGAGVRAYANTSTWRQRTGGQALTEDVCDQCWGSGDKTRPWVSLRAVERLRAEIDAIKGIVGHPGTQSGLAWDCPVSDVVRYLHQEWLRQTHAAEQRAIAAEAEAARLRADSRAVAVGWRADDEYHRTGRSAIGAAAFYAAAEEAARRILEDENAG